MKICAVYNLAKYNIFTIKGNADSPEEFCYNIFGEFVNSTNTLL